MGRNKYICGCGSANKVCDCVTIHKEAVEKTKEEVLDNQQLIKMTSFYKAFADLTRLKIINVLQICEHCVCDISVMLNMTKSAVSHQLKYLKKLNIVKMRKVGKVVYYSLADEHVNKIFDICFEHISEVGND